MMKVKNIIGKIFASLMVAAMVAPVLAATVSLSPDLGDERFAPVDTLDVGCVSSVDVELDAEEKGISSIYMDLSYAPDDLQIMRVDSDLDNLSYSIEYDTIKVDYTVPK